MPGLNRRVAQIVMLLLMLPTTVWAQRQQPLFESPQDTTSQAVHHAWTPLRIAKWSMLAGSAASAIYGFSQNRVADREYESIERLCQQDPAQCTRTGGSAYDDATLEARYQKVVTRDEHARVALLAGQVGVVASVVLFILDLHGSGAPQDIPYHPHRLQLGFGAHGVELHWHQASR